MTTPALGPQTYHVLGLEARVMVTSEQTGGSYSIFETVMPPGASTPRHQHLREDEWVWVVEGQMRVWRGDDAPLQTVQTGELLHVPRGLLHALESTGNVPLRIVALCAPGGFERFFPRVAELLRSGGGTDPAEIATLAESCGMKIV